MWRRVLSNISTISNVAEAAAGTGGGGGSMSKTWVRYMSKKKAENLRKINPKVPYPEATSIAQDLYNVFNQRGPLTYGDAWTSFQEAGVTGLNSKTHMKLMLKWMRGKKIIRQICQQSGNNKKFLLCTPDAAQAEQEARALEVKVPTAKKKSQNRKKQKK
ncbi:uncharacterized protein LOC141648207 [Silene latifolia]|uniref:uncharacterized protein LOC141648207 n=1 Tax=Silene latifolia TaxID=37657 RepID=UPI003D76F3FD